MSADEMMTACAARALRDGMTCFVGIGLPSAAANLARATHAPGGAHPSYALGYSQRDNDYYVAWDPISRDRERFLRWLKTDVFGAPDPPGLAGPGAGGEE